MTHLRSFYILDQAMVDGPGWSDAPGVNLVLLC